MAKQKRKPRWVEMAEENEQAAKDAAREAEIQNRANNQSGGSSSSTSQGSGKGLGGLFSSAVQTAGSMFGWQTGGSVNGQQRSNEVKAVYNPTTGNTDNYTNGIGKADGPGHGHFRANEQGYLSVKRSDYEPGTPNARRDATELDSRNNGS